MIKLVNADSREYLKEIEDESIDIIITDPPFGISYAEWDDVSHFFELEEEFYRVLKPNSFLSFGGQPRDCQIYQELRNFLICGR